MTAITTATKSFTTGQVAKICGLSQQTIIRCTETGQLKCWRVPGSRFRRIERAELLQFMRENGIPLHDFPGETS